MTNLIESFIMFSLPCVKTDSFSIAENKDIRFSSLTLFWFDALNLLLTFTAFISSTKIKTTSTKICTLLKFSTFLNLTHILTSIDFTTVHLRRHVCVWHRSFHTVNSFVTTHQGISPFEVGSFHDLNLMLQF